MKSTTLRRLTSLTYGDALATDVRVDGNIPVFSSGGNTGSHTVANTLAPSIVVGRKGSHGSVWWSDQATFVIDTAYSIDATNSRCDLRWLYYLLSSLRLNEMSTDVGVPGLSREKAYEAVVPAGVPLEQQRRIADFLDDQVSRIDNIIAARRQQIDRSHFQSTADLQQVADREISIHGQLRLRHAMRTMEQGWSPQADSRPAELEEWGVMRAGCLNGGISRADDNKALPEGLEPRMEYELRDGDLLLSRASGSLDLIGSVAVVPEGIRRQLILCDKIYRIDLDQGWSAGFVAPMCCEALRIAS